MENFSIMQWLMEKISTIKQLIDLWGTRSQLAEDVGVNTERVNGWAREGSIPARYHRRVCLSGQARGFNISAELIDRLHCDCSDGLAA